MNGNPTAIGISRNKVFLVPYKEEWPRLFEIEKGFLAEALGADAIQIVEFRGREFRGRCDFYSFR